MDEFAPGPAPFTPPQRVGDILRAARDKAGLSLAEVASRTRVPLRHLQAIEGNDYSSLPSPTYANGFAKAYARAVNLDEVAIGRQVRGELAGVTRAPAYVPVEATDPDRVPSRGLAIVALGVAVAVLILAALYLTGQLGRYAGAPAAVVAGTEAPPPVAPVAAPSSAPSAAAMPADGQVVVTAAEPVNVRLYDGDRTLRDGALEPGQTIAVPDTGNPMIAVDRPDRIRLTMNGSALTGLRLGTEPIADVRVSAAALTARLERNRDRASGRASERRRDTAARGTDRPRRAAPALSETQRANLEAARSPAATGNAQ